MASFLEKNVADTATINFDWLNFALDLSNVNTHAFVVLQHWVIHAQQPLLKDCMSTCIKMKRRFAVHRCSCPRKRLDTNLFFSICLKFMTVVASRTVPVSLSRWPEQSQMLSAWTALQFVLVF